VSPRETWISLIILIALVCIAGGILLVQQRFNPAVVHSIGARVLPNPSNQTASTVAADTLLDLPPGIRPLTPPETFPPERLSDKINGKAELYLSAGCKGLRSQRFTDSADQQRWMEIFVFDMGTYENAFAVYSSQRRDDAMPIELTSDGYRTENALYLIHGGYYVEFIASEASAAAFRAMETMARNFIEANRVEAAAVQEPELFPTDGLESDSIVMTPTDAFGFDRLDRVFTAVYRMDGGELTAFLSKRPSDRHAVELAAAYRDFLIRFGGTDITAQSGLNIPGAAVIEILGYYEMIFTSSTYLAGVHEAAEISSAAAVARKLYQRLEEGRSGK
jgi:hypothetical protein